MSWTTRDVIERLPRPDYERLPAPVYGKECYGQSQTELKGQETSSEGKILEEGQQERTDSSDPR